MSKDVRQMLNDFTGGLGYFSEKQPKATKDFMNLLESVYKPGAIDLKTKELISIAILVYNRCEDCIVYHVYKAFEAGATREEILEATMVAVVLGGGPSMLYSGRVVQKAIETFAPDFEK